MAVLNSTRLCLIELNVFFTTKRCCIGLHFSIAFAAKFKPSHQAKVSKNWLMFEQKKKKEVVTRSASQPKSGNFIVKEDLGGSKHFKQNPFCFLSCF